MTQEILIPEVKKINSDLLTSQLKAAAPADCYGIKFYEREGIYDVYIVTTDTIAAPLLATLKSIALAHDPDAKTPEQAAEVNGRADIADLLQKADTALAQLAAKEATFKASQNLANAAPLLIEIADDLQAAIKVLKFVVKRIN